VKAALLDAMCEVDEKLLLRAAVNAGLLIAPREAEDEPCDARGLAWVTDAGRQIIAMTPQRNNFFAFIFSKGFIN
jgi:hypothetical protein